MPKTDYNLIAIGAGSGGLVSSYIGAAVKAKVALIEKHKMGGDCLNTGCVPSKALIKTAQFLEQARQSKKLGLDKAEIHYEYSDIIKRVQKIIKKITQKIDELEARINKIEGNNDNGKDV